MNLIKIISIEYLTLLFLIFTSIDSCIGQQQLLLSTSDLSNIEYNLSRNIVIFRLHNTPVVENFTVENHLKKGGNLLYLVPESGYRLKFKIKEEKIIYPDSTYKVYSFYKSGDEYYTNNKYDGSIASNFPYPLKYDNYFLVAINDELDVKYLGGNMFLSLVADDFDFSNSESMLMFVKFKTFNYQFVDYLEIIKNDEQIVYEVLNSKTNKKLNLIVSRYNMENIEIPDFTYWR